MKWFRWLWFAVATGSFAAAMFFAATAQKDQFAFVLSAIAWFFVAIAFGGWKGLPVGIWVLVFVACLAGVWYLPQLLGNYYQVPNWAEAKHLLDGLEDKPGKALFMIFGLSAVIVLLLIIPTLVAMLTGKVVSWVRRQPASAQPAPRVQATQTVSRPKLPDVGEP